MVVNSTANVKTIHVRHQTWGGGGSFPFRKKSRTGKIVEIAVMTCRFDNTADDISRTRCI